MGVAPSDAMMMTPIEQVHRAVIVQYMHDRQTARAPIIQQRFEKLAETFDTDGVVQKLELDPEAYKVFKANLDDTEVELGEQLDTWKDAYDYKHLLDQGEDLMRGKGSTKDFQDLKQQLMELRAENPGYYDSYVQDMSHLAEELGLDASLYFL